MISMWKVRDMVDKATNLVMNYTETEAKVREATNDDPWGPSGAQMQEVAAFTFTYEQVRSLFGYFFIFLYCESSFAPLSLTALEVFSFLSRLRRQGFKNDTKLSRKEAKYVSK